MEWAAQVGLALLPFKPRTTSQGATQPIGKGDARPLMNVRTFAPGRSVPERLTALAWREVKTEFLGLFGVD